MTPMRARPLLWLAGAITIGAGFGCAALIGLSLPDATTDCLNPADQTALSQNQDTFVPDLVSCTLTNPGNSAAATACLQAKRSLSQPCAACAAQSGACASQSCGSECVGGAMGVPCQSCVATNCNAKLIACAGMPVYACVNQTDQNALTEHMSTLEMDGQTCGGLTPGDTDAIVACLQHKDGLTQPCALCYALDGLCALSQCAPCVNNPASPDCGTCVYTHCGPFFELCSGVSASTDGGLD